MPMPQAIGVSSDTWQAIPRCSTPGGHCRHHGLWAAAGDRRVSAPIAFWLAGDAGVEEVDYRARRPVSHRSWPGRFPCRRRLKSSTSPKAAAVRAPQRNSPALLSGRFVRDRCRSEQLPSRSFAQGKEGCLANAAGNKHEVVDRRRRKTIAQGAPDHQLRRRPARERGPG